MKRANMMALALMVLPTAPATAVVAIEATSTAAEVRTASPSANAPADNPFGLTNGEMVAALVGLSVVSMTLTLGRQQHSVSS